MAVGSAKTSGFANTGTSTGDREIVLTRLFDAPRELVFDMWTDPKHIAQWWGPNGFTTTIHQMDVRPGGVWRLVMHGPDGRNYNNRIVYLEIARPERLVYKHDPEEGSEPFHCEVTVTFAEEGRLTRLTMRMLFPSADARDHVVTEYGVIEGGNQTLGRLAEHLSQMTAPAKSDAGDPQLFITRVFDAPRTLVFAAWTKPEHLERWQGAPQGFTVTSQQVDLRPGGAFRICMHSPEGVDYWLQGVYREIVEPERLVFTHAWLDADSKPGIETLVALTFTEHGGKTELRLHQTGFKSVGSRDDHQGGWTSTLDRFDAYIVTVPREALS
jgi:uncharacterized protein YndB with AHSA1/START domain